MLVCERGPACAGQLVCSVWTARPPAALKRGAHAPGPGEVVGHIRGCEEWVQCDGTHEYTLTAHMQRWGLSHSSPNFPHTAPYSPPHSSPNMYT